MKKIKVGLIRVVTLRDEKLLNAHADILRNNFENLILETKCISDQPEGIHDTETEKIAVPKILDLAREFEKKDVDVVFISCAADPGIETARKFLKIPVLGAGSAMSFLPPDSRPLLSQTGPVCRRVLWLPWLACGLPRRLRRR